MNQGFIEMQKIIKKLVFKSLKKHKLSSGDSHLTLTHRLASSGIFKLFAMLPACFVACVFKKEWGHTKWVVDRTKNQYLA